MKKYFLSFFLIAVIFSSSFISLSTDNSNNLYSINLKQNKTHEEDLDVIIQNSINNKIKQEVPSYSNWIQSRSLSSASDLAFFMTDQFFFNNIQSSNIHDLAVVHYTLAFLDLYFTTFDPGYLFTAYDVSNSTLFLNMNDEMIALDTQTSDFKVYAYDNLYLTLMYIRLAKAFEIFTDIETANAFWNSANTLMAAITSMFYDNVNHIIKEYAFVSSVDWSIVNTSSYTTAEIAGLYSMVSHSLDNPSTYHTQSYDVIDYYFTNYLQIINLGEGFDRYVPQRGTDPAINDTLSFTGSIFLSSAFFYESKYQRTIGNTLFEDTFFVYGQWLLEDALAVFFVPEYNLHASLYNITSGTKGSIISTFDCALVSLALREFNRYHVEKYGFSPGELAISVIKSVQNTFKAGNFYDPGLSTDQGIFSYKVNEYKKNPIVINSMAISMELKKYTLSADVLAPLDAFTNETIELLWTIFWTESTNIFGYSNASFSTSYDFLISSTLNFTANDTIIIDTFTVDGVQVSNPLAFSINTTANEGGEYFPQFTVSIGEVTVLDFSSYIYVLKELRIFTDPSKLIATQGIDEYLEFSIFCEDEKGISVSKVNLTLTWIGNSTSVLTNNAGSIDIKIAIRDILALPEFAENPDENPRFEFEIFAIKDGYVGAWISKTVTIKRNSLMLEMSQDLVVKRGNDLTLTIDVQPQIQTLVVNPKAEIYLNGDPITNEVTQSVNPHYTPKLIPIPLPVQITLPTKDLKENAILRIEVESSNFPTTSFEFEIEIIPLTVFEAIYQWLSNIFSSTLGKILGSLSVVWAILWKQFSLYVLRIIKRCPYCGETVKKKYSTCRYCGNIIDRSKYEQAHGKFSTGKISEENNIAKDEETGFQ